MKKPSKSVSNLIQLRQSEILSRIAAGQSAASVAREMKLSERHIYRTLAQSPGLEALRQAVGDAHDVLRTRLPSLVSKSLDILENDLHHGFGDARRDAAKTVISTLVKLATSQPCPCTHSITTDQGVDQHETAKINRN